MIQNSHDDIINDKGNLPYVYKRKHNISNAPNKKEINNEDKNKSNKYKILLLLLLLLLIFIVLFFSIFFGLKTKKDDNHGRNMNVKLNNTIDNNTDKIIDNSINISTDNNIDNFVKNINNTIDDNTIDNIDNSINNNDNNDTNIDTTNDIIDNTIDYSTESSTMNYIDNNLDTSALDDNYILDTECANKKYSFKAIYHTNSDYENVTLINYLPNKIEDMIVDGFEVNEEEKQNNWYNFLSKGNHIVCILINITNCTSLQSFFEYNKNLVSISFTPEFNTENVEKMDAMFMGCSSLISINFSNLNIKKVKSMVAILHSCRSLKSIDFSNLDLRNVESMYKFCYMCDSLVSVNFTNTKTLNLTSYSGMFGFCEELTSVELPNFTTKNIDHMFDYCPNLRYIDVRNISCKPNNEYGYSSSSIGDVSNYGIIIINKNCSNVIQNSFSNWTIIID